MKNRQKLPVSEQHLLNQIGALDKDVERRYLELRTKKKTSDNPLIQKNIGLLHSYNEIFRVDSARQGGHPDAAFRRSLRSQDSLDIFKELQLEPVKRPRAKKRSILTQPHYCPSTHLTKAEGVEEKKSFQEIYSKDFASDSESEEKEFFSPIGEEEDHSQEEEEINQPFQEEEGPSSLREEEEISHQEDTQQALSKNEDATEPNEEEKDVSATNEEQQSDPEDNLQRATETLESIFKMAEEFADEEMDFEGDGEEEEDDELRDVEKMIQQASEELQKVAEENQYMMETLEEGDEGEEPAAPAASSPKAEGEGSVFKFDPAIEAAVLKELEEAEKQAKATAQVIADLKKRVGELLQKEKMTEAEAKELEEKNKALKSQMILFEQKTKRIQALLGQSNLFEKLQPVQPPLETQHSEDVLPKMLVCGTCEEYMPKLVMCHDKGPKPPCRPKSRGSKDPMAQKLTESYNLQEKLVNETAHLEGTRYQLQSDLINKDQTVEYLQRQLCSLQYEMRMVAQENAALKLQSSPTGACPNNSRANSPKPCGPGKGLCPVEVENRLQEYSNTTNTLERQLVNVEQEVKLIQHELLEVQKEREHLEHHRKMMTLPPPCPAMMPPCPPYPCPQPLPPCGHPPCPPPPCGQPPLPCFSPPYEDQQYKELKEKYSRLVEDFKAKLTEVAGLRSDNEKLKELALKAEEEREKMELKVKDLEKRIKEMFGTGVGDRGVGSKEQVIELQQQLKVHKELYRQAQDELEELRALVEDIQGQLNDYRNKYLEAIQTVEEQRRQIEIMRMENNRISEQVNLEIVRVKNQFQEKLQELAPLPDILKATQVKLQEAQQMHLLAERNNEAMARELQTYKDKLKEILDEQAIKYGNVETGLTQMDALRAKVGELEQMLQESKNENDELRIEMGRIKEISDENERIADEKLHEIVQLEAQLEGVRDESARQVARIKDRCEIVRKSMQNQISDLERQLAQTKACAKSAERDRDDIRLKMQAQIRNLNENFEDAQMRIRNLQGHVNFLKNSYCSPPTELGDTKPTPKLDPCCCNAEY